MFRQSVVLSLLPALIAAPVFACPFCSAVSQTFTEEISSMDVALIGQLVEAAPVPNFDDPVSLREKAKPSKFKVVKVLKGQSLLDGKDTVQTLYFGDGKVGNKFLLMGVDPPKLMWSTPLKMSDDGIEYVSTVLSLPKEGADRLAFFQQYLEHEDEMLAADAYDEFAKAPYDMVKELKDRMRHDKLVAWIKDTDVPASRRRLYLTMLGVCGSESDLSILEEMLKSDDRRVKAGLDAMIACYLTLKGPEGLGLIEDLFLKNKDAEYADTYAAIMAIRFHGSEADIIPHERLVKALRHMLDRPQLADLVIPDLWKWEDWESMDRLVTLFKESDEKTSWVRVPVINYLRACPLPEAKEHLKELEKIDPSAVKRAKVFFPTPSASSSEKSPQGEQSSSADGLIAPAPRVETASAVKRVDGHDPSQQGLKRSMVVIGGPALAVVALAACVVFCHRRPRSITTRIEARSEARTRTMRGR